jgi:hypothetical protein
VNTDITDRAEHDATAGETAACEAVIEFCGVLRWPCGQPDARLHRRICVHEHVAEGQLCREHVERQAAGLCATCYGLGGGLSHECPISVALVTA